MPLQRSSHAYGDKPNFLTVHVQTFEHLQGMRTPCYSHSAVYFPEPAKMCPGRQGMALACAAWRSTQAASSWPAPPWTAPRASGMLPAAPVGKRCGALPSPDPNPKTLISDLHTAVSALWHVHVLLVPTRLQLLFVHT